ncbi:hypothetical protein CPB83DRAFT_926527 [Crepidotus variabilis]|uniref:DUF1996 domain-containing protein n=1 Tax=Crepidotus variabilis TaxID=179855 RepID=A0A9P6JQH4_9AGAR|nr:hypothetical protein CPB83DRAFT_926527 [Crepidotus variabilis]
MQWKSLLSIAALGVLPNVNALLRFACSQLVIERLDPLLEPGKVSAHLHQIIGGSAFNVTMNVNNDLPSLSQCTSCTYSEDFSNYWTAVLYFKHSNGSFKRVRQLPGQLLGNANGGMTVYYSQPSNGGKVTSFPKGFRMIVGNAMTRSFDANNQEAKSLNFRCLSAGGGNGGVVGDPGTDSNALPKMKCLGGIRSQIVFPSCWDGKNLDSADHRSHVKYPNGSACPSTHPVLVPQIFIETVWDTTEFNNMWPSDGSQPFVYSMGDPTGTGQHADYVFGWQGDALQRAMDQCNSFGGACPTLKTQSIDAINKCTQASRVKETYEGWLKALPGCNPIQSGPQPATMVSGCGAPTTLAMTAPTPAVEDQLKDDIPITAAPPAMTEA